jgi:hypothetical protein
MPANMATMAQAMAASVALLDGDGDVGADAGQLDVLAGHRDRLGRDQEEPAAGHRHHHVPQQRRHGVGQFQAPEALPGRQAEHARRFRQFIGGTVFIDWYRLKAMFQACEVKIAKMAAHSTPSRLPGNSAMNGAMAIAWKPRIGTDCSTSSSGTMHLFRARQRVGDDGEREREQQRSSPGPRTCAGWCAAR